jgi:hypothetical protein
MAQQPENKNQAKGFSGLDSMVSDVSKDVEHAERVGQSNESRSRAAAPKESGEAEKPPAAPESLEKGTGTSSESSGLRWVLGAAAFIFVIWLIGNSSKQGTPTYSPPPVTVTAPAPARIPSPAPALAPFVVPPPLSVIGNKPPIGDGNVLDREQLRYCVSEKIRLNAIETIVSASRNSEIEKFNGLVADYNGRCGHFRYRRGSLESVRTEVEVQRPEIERNAKTAWARDSAVVSTYPQNQKSVSNDRKPGQRPSIPRSQKIPNPSESTIPAVTQEPNSAPSLNAVEKRAPPRTLDLSALNSAERSSIESACSNDKYLKGLAAYDQCLDLQLAKLRQVPRNIDLSVLNSAERSSIESACSNDKYLNGPAAYNQCLNLQLAKLAQAPRNIDLSALNSAERSSIESACSNDKYLKGPAAYNQCLNLQLAKLRQAPRNIDLSGLNSAERSSIESACSNDKYLNGPAAYNQCLSTQLAKRSYR